MKVLFMPANKTAEVKEGCTVLEAAKEQGVMIDSPCGGNYMCGKCKVLVTKGNDGILLPEEQRFLTEEEVNRGMRLACCCKVQKDMTVMVPYARNKGIKSRESQEIRTRQRKSSIGIAVDVGTTTIEVHVINLETFHIMKKAKCYNPQIAYGADVIARITYAAGNEQRERKLRELLLGAIDQEIREAVSALGHAVEEVKKVVLVGNTTMSYFIAGTALSALAKAPFTLTFKGNRWYEAEELGLLKGSKAQVYVGPNIGGHVGSDAFSCLIAADLVHRKGRYLLVDIGTNGEILLADRGNIYACSTAAGPAFEGAGLSCGMRAEQGAITKAVVKDEALICQVAGNVKAVGISGSGIIDVLAGMLRLQVMETSGYIKEEHCLAKGYEVTKDVFVSREDVRQIQLAKAAIFAGIMSLLKTAGVAVEELDQVYLAGAFGSNIDVVHAMEIGLLPKMPVNKVQYVGNAAIMGAKEMLRSSGKESLFADMAEKVKHVELANLEGFQHTFIESINFRSDLF